MYEPLHSYLIEYIIHHHTPGKIIVYDDLRNDILKHFNKRFIRLLDMRLEPELYALQHQGFITYNKQKNQIIIA